MAADHRDHSDALLSSADRGHRRDPRLHHPIEARNEHEHRDEVQALRLDDRSQPPRRMGAAALGTAVGGAISWFMGHHELMSIALNILSGIIFGGNRFKK